LANEIATFVMQHLQGRTDMEVAIVSPAGTGTTAFYLSKSLNLLFRNSQMPKTTVYAVSVALPSLSLLEGLKAQGTESYI
jgi:hypothetical protein